MIKVPIDEQIIQKVQARLKKISVGNGYCVTLADVVRPTRHGVTSPVDKLCLVIRDPATPLDSETRAGGNPPKIGRKITLYIVVFALQDDDDPAPYDSVVSLLLADCQKAITVPSGDGTAWGKWDGLAIESDFQDLGTAEDNDGKSAGGWLQLQIQYRTPENDPYTAA
jgi:hypothetical protein